MQLIWGRVAFIFVVAKAIAFPDQSTLEELNCIVNKNPNLIPSSHGIITTEIADVELILGTGTNLVHFVVLFPLIAYAMNQSAVGFGNSVFYQNGIQVQIWLRRVYLFLFVNKHYIKCKKDTRFWYLHLLLTFTSRQKAAKQLATKTDKKYLFINKCFLPC